MEFLRNYENLTANDCALPGIGRCRFRHARREPMLSSGLECGRLSGVSRLPPLVPLFSFPQSVDPKECLR